MSAQRAAWLLLVAGLLLILLYWYPDNWVASELVASLYANLSTSLISISITVLLIDKLYAQENRTQLKKRLIWEMGSTDQAAAIRAVKELRDSDWIKDGSLVGVDLAYANLTGARLDNVLLSRANLANSTLSTADFRSATLDDSDLEQVTAFDANFKDASLVRVVFRKARLQGAIMDGANCAEAELLGAQLPEASLRGAHLEKASLESCNLIKSDLSRTVLREASLRGATILGANLSGANLERADLMGLRDWEAVSSIKGAQILGVRNAPDGFVEWALKNGAIN
ncbi:pentapeptide repeat-containing protein [Nonomuraea sp. SBT364]|uniref:pentapeptide repeat-containing protein n=1 Tax=Nonomuraea sp. SBT364 TaxID=1580530 RepID=UPI00066CC01B|nr:pentapeptide repeat-containing protein [Nonomuraea sp. SBT364]